MKNITLALPEEGLRRARVRAARDGTSVNEVIRLHLERYGAEADRLDRAIDRILELSEKYGKGRRLEPWDRSEVNGRKGLRGRRGLRRVEARGVARRTACGSRTRSGRRLEP